LDGTDTNVDDDSNPGSLVENDVELLLQVMLLSPDVAAVSLSSCQKHAISAGNGRFSGCWWPNPHYPIGMALVDITTRKMPSSAYRKLLEAFACWGVQPSGTDQIVDLRASPGGWTAALLSCCDGDPLVTKGARGIHITAVDRSPLDPSLMRDPRVTFVQGDAFTFEPKEPVDWMVSDIIAYPERVIDLLHLWCGRKLASHMIVTIKFQGLTPSWPAVDEAVQVAKSYNYIARAKHFFNNKNEITLMLRHVDAVKSPRYDAAEYSASSRPIIPSFYKTALSN
jgi:hypothetical protein